MVTTASDKNIDLQCNNHDRSDQQGHFKQRNSSPLVDCAYTNANVKINGDSDANTNSYADGNATVRGSNQKSLIESESPQIPMFFCKGKFSQRRRIVKGKRIVSMDSHLNDSHNGTVFKNNNDAANVHDYNGQYSMKNGHYHSGQYNSYNNYSNYNNRTNRAVRRVQIVSKIAALASKRKIWDTNDASIDAAQSAVDKWESSYQTFRSFLINTSKSAKQVYDATKSASQKIENGLFVPIRDIILLPTFNTVERTADMTIGFIQSDEARNIVLNSLQIVKQTPFIGENILAPVLVTSFDLMRKSWEIAQYPIPSRENVRWSVDTIMTGTKWFLLTSSREIYFYAKLVDATVTRTLSHTQWRVLGYGPYSTLNKVHKEEVINHLCERYFSLKDDKIARYELAAHIKFHNRGLYHDLVVSGLLLSRGGSITEHDTWLRSNPEYRISIEDDDILLMRPNKKRENDKDCLESEQMSQFDTNVEPLWFYHPSQNGKKLRKEWVCFSVNEQKRIEDGFMDFWSNLPSVTKMSLKQQNGTTLDSSEFKEHKEGWNSPIQNEDQDNYSDHHDVFNISDWYEPNINGDVLIEHQRHAISFLPHCPNCKSIHSEKKRTQPVSLKIYDPMSSYGSLCKHCIQDPTSVYSTEDYYTAHLPLSFPLTMLMRPTLWRFHGRGNDVLRGVWLMDTQRGLQPYSDESAAVLEDAYLFLKWTKSSEAEGSTKIDSVLLTVQVYGPDGEELQLVQFRSLTQITAIQKTIAGGFSLFKRRVYRGAQRRSHQGLKGFPKDDEKGNVDKSLSRKSQELLAVPLSLQDSSTFLNDDHLAHNSADHLILVVHGIGEMLRSSEFFGMSLPPMTSSIVDCCSSLRKNHAEVLAAHQSNNSSESASAGRVEYLPVEWHEPFAVKSRWAPGEAQGHRDFVSLEDISLTTIPHMREFANDTMLDILFFMSPKHHDIMIDIVCSEMNIVVQKYKALTGFSGKVSLLTHSLGAVISWDILSHQSLAKENNVEIPSSQGGLRFFSSERNQNKDIVKHPQLDFRVANTFMIGSPLAVFLMLRNQHNPLDEDFYLPGCRRVFNIFHPYDPVAYRIEPLISRDNSNVEPKIITHWKGGFRVQYQTKLLWRQIVDNTMRTQKTVVRAVEAGIEGIGLLDKTVDDLMLEDDDESSIMSDDTSFQVIQVGNLCGGKRLDYMLQEKEIENANEYLSALAAHSSYWGERDLSLFIARQIFHSDQDQKGNF